MSSSQQERTPMERYMELNVQFLRALQQADFPLASELCQELDRIFPNHPNIVAFKTLLAEHNESMSKSGKSSGAAIEEGDDEDGGDEASDSASENELMLKPGQTLAEDEEDEKAKVSTGKRTTISKKKVAGSGDDETQPGVQLLAGTRPTRKPRPAGATAAPQAQVGTAPARTPANPSAASTVTIPPPPEDGLTDEDIDKMFAGSDEEAARIMQHYGIMH